jgi:hypothetical protein
MQIDKGKIYHKASTKDYLISLGSMLSWSKILYDNVDKHYKDFLQFLITKQFYIQRNKPLVIKEIIAEFGRDGNKISKWLPMMYEDLVMLNENQPELFKGDDLRHEIYYKNYDSYGGVTMWLERTPQVFEGFVFPFAKASVGTDMFFVGSVEHRIDNAQQIIHLQLQAGLPQGFYKLRKLSLMALYDRVML